jgi:hypothetical protein
MSGIQSVELGADLMSIAELEVINIIDAFFYKVYRS